MAKAVLVLDPTFAEESCSPASVTIAVSRDCSKESVGDAGKPYKVCGIYKNGSGSFMPEELLLAVNVSWQMFE